MQTIDKLRKFAKGGGLNKDDLANIQNFELSNLISLDDTEQANYDNWKEAKDWLTNLKTARRYARRFGTDEQVDQLTSAIRTQRMDTRDLAQADGVGEGRLQAGLDNFENAMSSTTAKVGLNAAVGAVNAVDQMAMGDKNFGTQSAAIDGAVHAASSALMQSGNPYAMAAGAALEGANFLTKAGGQTVQGFDVDINSSGYGDLGHMESSSSRDFGAMIGLGGLNQGKMQAKLAKRNQQAMMAMNAANIANEQSFEQEARMNSVQNTIMNNQIALAGGMDTSLLGG